MGDFFSFVIHEKLNWISVQFTSVPCHVWLFVTPWTAACQASLSITNSWSLLKLMTIVLVMPYNYLILCCLLLLLPSIFPTSGSFPMSQFLASGGQCWSFSFSISPSNEYSASISFRIDCLISLQSKRLSKVFNTTVQKYQFFDAQPSLWSNSHICTWVLEKTIALTIQTFVWQT